MNELKLVPTTTQVAQKSLGPWLESLRVGQVIKVTVADKTSTGALLRAAGHLITASTDLPVSKGDVLNLQVVGVSPAPQLKVINPAILPGGQPNPLEGYLKLLVPAQGRVLDPLLSLLNPAQNANILSLLGMSRRELDKIYRVLSQGNLLADPGSLETAARQSGIFLEGQLLALLNSGGILPPGDLKAALLMLLGRVNRKLSRSQPGPAADAELRSLLGMRGELEGALATITLKQLAAWQVHEHGGYAWTFDIPLQVRDELHCVSVKVEREGGGAEKDPEQQEWKVLLSVNLLQLGEIEAELFLRGARVSVVIYAQRSETARLVDGSLLQLKDGLDAQGLNVSVLLCHQGRRGGVGPVAQWNSCLDEKV